MGDEIYGVGRMVDAWVMVSDVGERILVFAMRTSLLAAALAALRAGMPLTFS